MKFSNRCVFTANIYCQFTVIGCVIFPTVRVPQIETTYNLGFNFAGSVDSLKTPETEIVEKNIEA